MKCPICQSQSTQHLFTGHDDRYAYPGEYEVFFCAVCEHRFLNQSFTGEELTEMYSKYYPRKTFDPSRYQPYRTPKGMKAWLKGEKQAYAFVSPKSRVLDIGCGTCESLGYFVAQGCEAYGVEADKNVEKIAKHYGFNVRIGLFDSQDFHPDYFDFVTMEQVVEHLPDPIAVLRDVAKVLKRGGKLIMTTPDPEGLGARVFGKKWINWHIPYHLHFFSRKSLDQLAKRAGFEIEILRHMTPTAWTYYQEVHLAHYPELGKPSEFWNNSYTRKNQVTKIPPLERAAEILQKTGINHLWTRAADGLGLGDNFVAILRKP